MAVTNPLTDNDLEQINIGIEKSREAKQLIDIAQRAGIDVTEFQARASDAEAKLLRIKQAFFPGI